MAPPVLLKTVCLEAKEDKLAPCVDARDAQGKTALMHAAAVGCFAACKALVEAGAELNFVDDGGNSARDRAEEGKHTDVARFLRDLGAVTGIEVLKFNAKEERKTSLKRTPESTPRANILRSGSNRGMGLRSAPSSFRRGAMARVPSFNQSSSLRSLRPPEHPSRKLTHRRSALVSREPWQHPHPDHLTTRP